MALRGRATQQSRNTRKTNLAKQRALSKSIMLAYLLFFHIKSSQIGHAFAKNR